MLYGDVESNNEARHSILAANSMSKAIALNVEQPEHSMSKAVCEKRPPRSTTESRLTSESFSRSNFDYIAFIYDPIVFYIRLYSRARTPKTLSNNHSK